MTYERRVGPGQGAYHSRPTQMPRAWQKHARQAEVAFVREELVALTLLEAGSTMTFSCPVARCPCTLRFCTQALCCRQGSPTHPALTTEGLSACTAVALPIHDVDVVTHLPDGLL